MGAQNDAEKAFDSKNLILYFYVWRKPLIIITLLAAVIAAIFSSPYFITPKFRSSVTVFPSTTTSPAKALLPQQFAGRNTDILEFGSEGEAEQLLQILHSDEIRERIIEKYNLIQHYGIDTSSRYVRTKMFKAFDENISFERTEFMSIDIHVLDPNPDTAALIANDIVSMLDDVKNKIQKDRAEQGLKIIEREYNSLKRQIEEVEDSLTALRYKGVHSYEEQVAALSEQVAYIIVNNGYDSWQYRGARSELDTLAKYGGVYNSMGVELSDLKEKQSQMKIKLDQAKVDVELTLPSTFVVNKAYPAEKKSYPVRWLIVVISAMAAFIFTLVGITVYNTFKKETEKLSL